MTWFMKSVVVITVCMLLTVSAALAGSSRHGKCEATVETELSRLNIDRTDIASISMNRQTRSQGDNEVTSGYDVWVRFKSCKGVLVVPMRTSCRVRTSYTRGECKIDGVKHW